MEELRRRIQVLEEKVLALQDELTQLEYAMEVVYEILEMRSYKQLRAHRLGEGDVLEAVGH